MTTTAEPQVQLSDAVLYFLTGSSPARAQIREAEYYRNNCDDVDWWEGVGPHFTVLLESAVKLAQEAEDLEAEVRDVMAAIKSEDDSDTDDAVREIELSMAED